MYDARTKSYLLVWWVCIEVDVALSMDRNKVMTCLCYNNNIASSDGGRVGII